MKIIVQNYEAKGCEKDIFPLICDPNDCLFEPTIAWLSWLMKVYQKNDEVLHIEKLK